ncbi:MAG: hypothetical protein MJE66_09915 [Proteobacteria bacterium]|nr:hypothetical protein [Pseudomonadota bacterium]
MRIASPLRLLAPLAVLLSALLAASATAERISLAPSYASGDRYTLVLTASTKTEALSRGASGKSVAEDVQLHYRATVVVLATDATGRPARERHEDVALTYERPGETGSLFRKRAAYEVRRTPEGQVQLYLRGRRLEARVEELVAGVLEQQFEYTLAPQLFDPGREVAVDESWPLDPSLTRRYLQARGVRVIELGAPGTATLRREGDGALVIDYRIPVAWFELETMPDNAQAANSEAVFEGRIHVPQSDRVAWITSSRDTLRMNGVVRAPGVAGRAAWRFDSERRHEQETRALASRAAILPASPQP